MTRIWVGLVAIVLALAGWLQQPGAAAAPAVDQVHAYTYDDHTKPAASTFAATERGPPTMYDHATASDTDGQLPFGSSARPSASTSVAIYGYDHLARVVQVVRSSHGAQEPVGGAGADTAVAQRSGVAANGGNRVFWSGGDVAKNAAADYAKANGGKTLEMTLTGRALEKIPYNRFTKPVTGKLWDLASWRFARSARGDAHVFFGPNAPRPGSVFARIEGPILDRRGNSILQHFLE